MAAARTVRPSTATIACEMTSHATISTALTAVLLQSNGQLEELKAQNKAHAEASDAQIEELKTELAESKAAREIEARTGSRVDYHKIVAFTALADENIRNAKKLEEVTEKLEEVSGMLTAVSQALRDGAAKQRELSENIAYTAYTARLEQNATDITKEEQMMEQMEQMMEQMMESKQNHLETQQTLKALRDGAGKLAGALASREDEGRHGHAYA
jgi:hypothetical protein